MLITNNGDSKISKLNANGDTKWTQVLTQNHAINDLEVVNDQLYAVGRIKESWKNIQGIYKSLNTETGEINWQKEYGTSNSWIGEFTDVESDGSSLYLGTSSYGMGKSAGRGAYVVKVALDGTEEWFSKQTVDGAVMSLMA